MKWQVIVALISLLGLFLLLSSEIKVRHVHTLNPGFVRHELKIRWPWSKP